MWPVFLPHVIGAILFFVTAFAHMFVQTRLMYTLARAPGGFTGAGTVRTKTLLTAIASVCVVFSILHEKHPPPTEMIIFAPVGETFYIKYPPSASFSIAAEWVFVFCYLLYFATYASDFRDCTFFLDIYVLDYAPPPPPQPPHEL
ncbi:uncharacterized protein LOC125945006 [Dermacentor silvarum]|uniref:uncharacterized protein LOC125945006 n=1 Tax=Dermacentor silvarum TaxID=543639 RepID=UPI002101A984|nr:uncharacterized protein LOC125945006 [Dermacentor silvarum]